MYYPTICNISHTDSINRFLSYRQEAGPPGDADVEGGGDGVAEAAGAARQGARLRALLQRRRRGGRRGAFHPVPPPAKNIRRHMSPVRLSAGSIQTLGNCDLHAHSEKRV